MTPVDSSAVREVSTLERSSSPSKGPQDFFEVVNPLLEEFIRSLESVEGDVSAQEIKDQEEITELTARIEAQEAKINGLAARVNAALNQGTLRHLQTVADSVSHKAHHHKHKMNIPGVGVRETREPYSHGHWP